MKDKLRLEQIDKAIELLKKYRDDESFIFVMCHARYAGHSTEFGGVNGCGKDWAKCLALMEHAKPKIAKNALICEMSDDNDGDDNLRQFK